MKKRNMTVISGIAQMMIDLQVKHSLPINIIVGDCMTDFNGCVQQNLLLEYEEEDFHGFAWLVDKAVIKYVNEVIMREDDKPSPVDDIATEAAREVIFGMFGIEKV